MTRCLAILGNGGHAAVVSDAAEELGLIVCSYWELSDGRLQLADLRDRLPDNRPQNNLDRNHFNEHRWFLGVGDLHLRASMLQALKSQFSAPSFPNVIARSARVSTSALLGQGVYVGHLAQIGAFASVGDFVILNNGCNVEHHAIVGGCTHIAPGAALLGGASVGVDSFLGAGSIVAPRISIPGSSIVAANSFVKDSFETSGLLAGNPARYKGLS